jgi:hypothetical protein
LIDGAAMTPLKNLVSNSSPRSWRQSFRMT